MPIFDRRITVKKLTEVLGELWPNDVLVINDILNLSIIRNNDYIGFIDINNGSFSDESE